MAKKSTHTHIQHRDLPCALTDADKAQLSDEMAKAELEIEQLKDEAQALNAQKRKLEGHRNALAHAVEDGVQDRSVECHWEENLAQNVKRLIRQDTKKMVEEVALTAEDRMDDLPGTEGNVTPIAGGKGDKKPGK